MIGKEEKQKNEAKSEADEEEKLKKGKPSESEIIEGGFERTKERKRSESQRE